MKNGLVSGPGFYLAAHPCAPLAEYLAAVRERVLLGYHYNGFPDTTVDVSLDRPAGKVRVRVKEGPQYVKGAVRLVGVKALDAEGLRRRLTEAPLPQPTRAGLPGVEESVREVMGHWVPGMSAGFDEPTLAAIAAKVKRAYADAGHFFPRLKVRVVPEKGTPQAHLLVEVEDEGARATLRDVDIMGLRRNTEEELLRFLGIKPGMPLNAAAIAAMEDKLWRSARFLVHQVSLDPPEDASGAVRLRLQLRESRDAPPLGTELSAPARALLRVSDWLAAFPAGDRDAVVTVAADGVSVELVVSPRQGLLLRGRMAGAPGRGAWDILAVLASKQLGIFSLAGEPRGWTITEDIGLVASFGLVGVPEDPDTPRLQYAVRFGLGLRSSAAHRDTEPFRLDLGLAPVAFAGQAYAPDVSCSIANGVLTLRGPNSHWQFDEATGELREGTIVKAAELLPTFVVKVRVRLEAGRFAALRKEAEAAAAGRIKTLTMGEADATAAQALLVEALALLGATAEQRASATRLAAALAEEVGASLDSLAPDEKPIEGRPFDLPLPVGQGTGEGLVQWFALRVLPATDALFPRCSWPWMLAREAILVACGMGKYTGEVLPMLYGSDQMGPVGFLATARLLSLVNPRMARAFAARGLERLSVAEFRKDYRILLTGDTAAARLARRLAARLAEARGEDCEAVAALLGPAAGGPFREFARLLRERPKDKAPADVLPAALDYWWDAFLKEQVRTGLQRLAPPPAK
ncbi:MAG: hypothetical protein FJ290_29545 [Planctomycetes bacterium]|nr:hypothetical protein [Planctomycetota bacterium]